MHSEVADSAKIWNSAKSLVLASKSTARGILLERAGVPFERDPANIDERGIESAFIGHGGNVEGLAAVLAQAKAIEVSRRHQRALCLGSDQVLIFEGDTIHKAESTPEVFDNLQRLSGRAHLLVSAFAIALDARVIRNGVDQAKMTMRVIDDERMALYLRFVGPGVLESVGGYMLEAAGIQLFEKIEGDEATLLGMPLLGVLSALREQCALLL